ncbi:nucleolar pre-ribosomal-associated protein 1-like [Patella vulgata]|uniref:nucleolar pre-ribosomal-associated protein 1-like n=1 Tax=Patella vulgata TaxID=6465 RepID=UPI0024A7BACE|nr:nucleolar pre-ribosomal-associated protein 1-like [Patella vulgata]
MSVVHRKRKKPKDDADEGSVIKKTREVESFNQLKFKSMLKNIDTTFLALEEFADAANGFPDFTEYDIVKDYIQNSPDCAEVFQLLDGKTPKSTEIAKIFRVLECILIRTGDDLAEKYGKVGESIVSHLTKTNFKQIYLSLNISNKSNQLKNSLKLLAAMVIQGDNSAVSVLSLFDEKNQGTLLPLYKRKNISDHQDVRTCVVHFIIALLLTGSNSIIRQLLKKTALLHNIFYGISEDKFELIEVVLPIFQEKVVENGGISKSLKVAVFNPNILNHLTQLYYWSGPQKWKENKKDDIQDTASAEDKVLVIEMVHKFLVKLCCSFKYGIAYYDKSTGTGKM